MGLLPNTYTWKRRLLGVWCFAKRLTGAPHKGHVPVEGTYARCWKEDV